MIDTIVPPTTTVASAPMASFDSSGTAKIGVNWA
jgi:hypothetical protein